MQIFDNFDVIDDHRSGSVSIHVGASDGDSKKWLEAREGIRPDGSLYKVEEASNTSKDDWLSKLGYLVAQYSAKVLGCKLT